MSPVGTPVVKMHYEVETDQCICPRLRGCGGVKHIVVLCPEHGVDAVQVKFHTHAMQVDRISVGTHAL